MIFFFCLGVIIGSFLNVVIYRINTKKSLGGRSACMTCQNKLSWYELIPVFSFFALMGRCKICKTKISIQYPLVELTSGLIFVSLFIKFQDILFIDVFNFIFVFTYYAFMFSILLVISTYDIKHKIIPDQLSLMLAAFAFIGMFFFNAHGYFVFHIPTLFDFMAGVAVSLPFALLWLVSRGTWMGLGDAKLAVGLGWLLGFSRILSATAIAFWSGAIIGIVLVIISKRYKMRSEIPFAPYLVFGSFLVFILDLYIFSFFQI